MYTIQMTPPLSPTPYSNPRQKIGFTALIELKEDEQTTRKIYTNIQQVVGKRKKIH
jgi:hypothetical protein